MKKNQINHNALTHLVEAGAVSVVIVKAMGDTWALTVQVGDTLKIVMAKNSGKPRMWRKLDTLAKYLKDLGVDKFHIDVSKYDPSLKSLTRPDSANTLKQAHQSHQSLKKQQAAQAEKTEYKRPTEAPTQAPEVRVNISPENGLENTVNSDQVEVTEPVKLTATDRAIQQAKERWELRRAKILKEENPRAK